MSHVAAIAEFYITDLDAAAKACEMRGCELMIGQKTHKWYEQWVNDYGAADAAYHHGIKPENYGKCDHAIRVKGNADAYEIGLVARPDGQPGWMLVYDFWGSQGRAVADACGGQDLAGLRDAYGLHATLNEYATVNPGEQPWNIEQVELAGGGYELRMTR